MLRINPDLVDMDKANAEFPPFPDYSMAPTGPVHTAFFFTAPGSVYWATKSGTWGDARGSTPEIGERYLAGRRALDAAVLDEHREDVQGDAAALAVGIETLAAVSRHEGREAARLTRSGSCVFATFAWRPWPVRACADLRDQYQ